VALIEFRDVTKTWRSGRQTIVGVERLTLTIDEGEFVAIVGRTGCGKSTTVNLLLGLLATTSGTLTVGGVDPQRDFRKLRGWVAPIFQTDRLLPWLTALENVCLPLEILGIDDAAHRAEAQAWLERLGLRGYEHVFPHELSGGMRQRVAISRALVVNPRILIADEAFGHLDEVTAEKLRQDFRDIVDQTKKTVIFITHTIDEAVAMAHRVIVMAKPGHVVADLPVPPDLPDEARATLRTAIFDHIAGVGARV
jgi:NitT/TauT family transport system ATP-binding protein